MLLCDISFYHAPQSVLYREKKKAFLYCYCQFGQSAYVSEFGVFVLFSRCLNVICVQQAYNVMKGQYRIYKEILVFWYVRFFFACNTSKR